ncbi:hypothetical protein EVAR_72324_1 [Eumeta japonica]|uniref:Uncharacterized protein n=1 Tax=Eumeta variegata TaxID=151549 RepID=A0A4C1S7P2_EUMVA|nr:hypothetical protein EVAR_72324_1 [Eumeta japonica]
MDQCRLATIIGTTHVDQEREGVSSSFSAVLFEPCSSKLWKGTSGSPFCQISVTKLESEIRSRQNQGQGEAAGITGGIGLKVGRRTESKTGSGSESVARLE